MGADLARAMALVAFPVLAAVLGAVLAARRPPGPRLISAVQHFAAGVVFAAAAGEVLPELRRDGHLLAVVLGFSVGVAVLLVLQQWERVSETAAETSAAKAGSPAGVAPLPVGLLAAIGIDLGIDGILVGLGATLSDRQGVILTVALTLEIGFLALAVTAELTERGTSSVRAALIPALLSLAVVAGALLAVLALSGAPGWVRSAVLAGGIAALLFLVTEELITEAHESARETPLLTSLFFLGFLALYVLAAE